MVASNASQTQCMAMPRCRRGEMMSWIAGADNIQTAPSQIIYPIGSATYFPRTSKLRICDDKYVIGLSATAHRENEVVVVAH